MSGQKWDENIRRAAQQALVDRKSLALISSRERNKSFIPFGFRHQIQVFS